MNYIKHGCDIKKIISSYLSINKNTVKEINKINIEKIKFVYDFCNCNSKPILMLSAKIFKDKKRIDRFHNNYKKLLMMNKLILIN